MNLPFTLKEWKTYIYGIKVCSLALDVTALTGKIIKIRHF